MNEERDPTVIMTKEQALAAGAGNVGPEHQDYDPRVILPKSAAGGKQAKKAVPQPQQERPQMAQQPSKGQTVFNEVDWNEAARILHTQGKALQGMESDAAKTSAAVLLAFSDALVSGMRAAIAKRG